VKNYLVFKRETTFEALYNEFTACVDRFDVISFDVFDTLISRKVANPTDIFDLIEKKTGKRGFAKKRVMAEMYARGKTPKGIEDVSIDDIYSELKNGGFGYLEQNEIDEELDSCYKNPAGYKLYSLAREKNKMIIAVSDMYLPPDIILKILVNAGYPDVSRLFVSGEYGKTKSTGHLFSLVLDELNIDNNKIMHIGDNYRSDILGAGKAGILGLHFPANNRQDKRLIFFRLIHSTRINRFILFVKRLCGLTMFVNVV
jgi:HAD superfamily hydrolase (TIGR01549 family)